MNPFVIKYAGKAVGFLASVPKLFWICLILCLGWHITANKLETAQQLAADRLVVIKDLEKAAKEVPKVAQKTVEVEVVKYRDRVQYIKGEARVIEKQVPIYIPAGTPDLPGGFRLLHDAAAQGRSIAGDPAGNEGSPVPVETAALTIADNYQSCLIDKEKLAFFQRMWAKLEEQYGVIGVD